MMGEHNVQNSLAAIAVAHEMGADDDTIRKALAGFGGVKRRFTRTGEVDGITVIDDYGHHPVEIAAVLRAARAATPRQGDRRRAAAPLHAPRPAVRGILHLLQRCRPGASSPMSMPPARRRSRASTATRWSKGLIGHGHRHVLALPGPADLAAHRR